MKKDFTYIFLTCSLLLILGHSILPHDHMEREHSACEIKATKSLSLSEIIKLAMAHDIGANHLQEFKNCQPVECTLRSMDNELYELQTRLIDKSIAPCSKGICLIGESVFTSKLYFEHQSLRAPPVIS